MAGKRSGLFFEIMRLVDEIRPTFIFLENVPAITTRGLREVTAEITKRGYDSRWTVISAAEVGANHLRKRWWLLAYSNSNRCRELHKDESQRKQKRKGETNTFDNGAQEFMADSERQREQRLSDPQRNQISNASGSGQSLANAEGAVIDRKRAESNREQGGSSDASWWSTEPDVGRVVNGVSCRVDRIRGLGNAVVPAQAREAFKRLMGLK